MWDYFLFKKVQWSSETTFYNHSFKETCLQCLTWKIKAVKIKFWRYKFTLTRKKSLRKNLEKLLFKLLEKEKKKIKINLGF